MGAYNADMYICLPAIVRVSEPLNVLLPLLSIYRYRCTTMETLTSTRALNESCVIVKNNIASSIFFWMDTTLTTISFIFYNVDTRCVCFLLRSDIESIERFSGK